MADFEHFDKRYLGFYAFLKWQFSRNLIGYTVKYDILLFF